MTDTSASTTLARLRLDLMARVGIALMHVQITERALRLITTFVFQKSSPIMAEAIIAQTESERKKTMGYFLAELRKRVDLDRHFDSTLAEFLRRRNMLAHNLSDLPGWDTDTHHGIYLGRCFVNELLEMNDEVLKVFTGLIRAWQIQIGDTSNPPPVDHDFFKEVDARYVSLAEELFFAKDDQK